MGKRRLRREKNGKGSQNLEEWDVANERLDEQEEAIALRYRAGFKDNLELTHMATIAYLPRAGRDDDPFAIPWNKRTVILTRLLIQMPADRLSAT